MGVEVVKRDMTLIRSSLIKCHLGDCLKSGVSCELVLKSVIVYVYDLRYLLITEFLVSHTDERSHCYYRALLYFLVYVGLLQLVLNRKEQRLHNVVESGVEDTTNNKKKSQDK